MFEVHWDGIEYNKETKKYEEVNKTHGKFNTLDEAMKSIYEWWNKNNFKPPYIRQWEYENIIWIDYGSHICFYAIHRI